MPPEHLTLSPHRWLGGEAELGGKRCVWEGESPEGPELAGRLWGSVRRLYGAEIGAGGSVRALRARPGTFV